MLVFGKYLVAVTYRGRQGTTFECFQVHIFLSKHLLAILFGSSLISVLFLVASLLQLYTIIENFAVMQQQPLQGLVLLFLTWPDQKVSCQATRWHCFHHVPYLYIYCSRSCLIAARILTLACVMVYHQQLSRSCSHTYPQHL